MTDVAIALKALQLMDLTSLNDSDTNEDIITLCYDAKTSFANTAAICIYPHFIRLAKQTLKELGMPDIKVATVVNFPHGSVDIQKTVMETKAAIADGANEIDVVFPYKAFMAGDKNIGFDLVAACKEACGNNVLLKVIIETGELQLEDLIKEASRIAIKAGADFIKTSTGKVAVNATPEFARMMLEVIRDLNVADRVGFKPAGGVRTIEDASKYLQLTADILGDDWATAKTFRFGASGLLNNLLNVLEGSEQQVNLDVY